MTDTGQPKQPGESADFAEALAWAESPETPGAAPVGVALPSATDNSRRGGGGGAASRASDSEQGVASGTAAGKNGPLATAQGAVVEYRGTKVAAAPASAVQADSDNLTWIERQISRRYRVPVQSAVNFSLRGGSVQGPIGSSVRGAGAEARAVAVRRASAGNIHEDGAGDGSAYGGSERTSVGTGTLGTRGHGGAAAADRRVNFVWAKSNLVELCQLRHPNVVTTFGASEWNFFPVLVEEYLELGPLNSLLAESGIELEYAALHALSSGIVAGIRYLHDFASPKVARLTSRSVFVGAGYHAKIRVPLRSGAASGAGDRQAQPDVWSPPEAIRDNTWTPAADIYAVRKRRHLLAHARGLS